MCNQNLFIYLNIIFFSNTNQNVVNSTVINTKVPKIIIFNMFYYVLYKFLWIIESGSEILQETSFGFGSGSEFFLDSLQP